MKRKDLDVPAFGLFDSLENVLIRLSQPSFLHQCEKPKASLALFSKVQTWTTKKECAFV